LVGPPPERGPRGAARGEEEARPPAAGELDARAGRRRPARSPDLGKEVAAEGPRRWPPPRIEGRGALAPPRAAPSALGWSALPRGARRRRRHQTQGGRREEQGGADLRRGWADPAAAAALRSSPPSRRSWRRGGPAAWEGGREKALGLACRGAADLKVGGFVPKVELRAEA